MPSNDNSDVKIGFSSFFCLLTYDVTQQQQGLEQHQLDTACTVRARLPAPLRAAAKDLKQKSVIF